MSELPYILEGKIGKMPVDFLIGDISNGFQANARDVLAVTIFSSSPDDHSLGTIYNIYPKGNVPEKFCKKLWKQNGVPVRKDPVDPKKTDNPILAHVTYHFNSYPSDPRTAISAAVYDHLSKAAARGSKRLVLPMLGKNTNRNLSPDESARAMLDGIKQFINKHPESKLAVTIAVDGKPSDFSRNRKFAALLVVFTDGGFVLKGSPRRDSVRDVRKIAANNLEVCKS
jgi:hypothetical protein